MVQQTKAGRLEFHSLRRTNSKRTRYRITRISTLQRLLILFRGGRNPRVLMPILVISSVVIDLGKTTFHLVALGEQGKVLLRKKFSRKQLLIYTAKLQAALIGIEACSGAHFIGAALRDQGHQVRLIPAQLVKPFLKSNKNDRPTAPPILD